MFYHFITLNNSEIQKKFSTVLVSESVSVSVSVGSDFGIGIGRNLGFGCSLIK